MTSQIHPTAIVSESAVIGKHVSIGPYALIGPDVTLGDGCQIDRGVIVQGHVTLGEAVKIGPYSALGLPSHIVNDQEGDAHELEGEIHIGKGNHLENHITIKGKTTIGEGNLIGAYCTIGFPAQDSSHTKAITYVEIGNHNQLREYVSIQCGSIKGGGVTRIGNDNILLVYSHIGHDAQVGDHCAFSNSTNLAGHVEIGSHVVTGGFACFHQFCKVGDYSMIGGMSGVYQDAAPYMLCTGHRATVYGINLVGLKRNGFNSEEIQMVQQIYNIFFTQSLPPVVAKRMLIEKIPDGPILKRFIDFLENSGRGLMPKEIPT
ncbi:acyl-ACP--UDP-N-acetylglucosamine O-acyltransferase [Deltaproteobacteria bacterium TL4]